jgi:hypothetical protein
MNTEIHTIIKEMKEKLNELEYLVYLEEGELTFIERGNHDKGAGEEGTKTGKRD